MIKEQELINALENLKHELQHMIMSNKYPPASNLQMEGGVIIYDKIIGWIKEKRFSDLTTEIILDRELI